MLTIRNTRISDAPAVTQCIAAVASERCYLLSTKGFSLERTQAFIQFVRNTGGVHLVILDGVDIVGWCDVAPGTFEGLTHAGQLGMGLLPQYRGQGWGRKLLANALEAAFRQNFERVELMVFASNTIAVNLYRSLGFQEEGRKRKARKLEGKYDDILVYALLREDWDGRSMFIRRTQKGDAQILRSLGIAALSDAPYAFGAKLEDVLQTSLDKFAADALRHSESDRSTSFLAFAHDRPIGMIGAFFEQPSQRAFICSFWVQDLYRGGACSTKLLSTAKAWLKEHGAQKCYAWVVDSNIRAINFYNKHNFINSGINQPLPSNPSELEHLYECTI